MRTMKLFFAALICVGLLVAGANPASAHCGKCGMGDDSHKEDKSDASMLGQLEKKQADIDMLKQSAAALKESNPELAQKLETYSEAEQKGLDEKLKWIAAHKEEMKKMESDLSGHYEGSHSN